MNNGYIKLHRKITKWGWYKDGNTVRLFIHLLLMANHEDQVWHGIEIQRGQRLTSRASLAEELDISERQVRTALNHLISTNEVTSKATNKYTLITIENYSDYQASLKRSDQVSGQENDQQPTSNRPATDQQPTTNKNEKNDKNEREREKKVHTHSCYGKLNNLCFSDAEYQDIQNTYQRHMVLIDKISLIVANAKKEYKSHYALLLKVAEEDGWAKKKKTDEPLKAEVPKKQEPMPDEIKMKMKGFGRERRKSNDRN